jgi:hypothetical protein
MLIASKASKPVVWSNLPIYTWQAASFLPLLLAQAQQLPFICMHPPASRPPPLPAGPSRKLIEKKQSARASSTIPAAIGSDSGLHAAFAGEHAGACGVQGRA